MMENQIDLEMILEEVEFLEDPVNDQISENEVCLDDARDPYFLETEDQYEFPEEMFEVSEAIDSAAKANAEELTEKYLLDSRELEINKELDEAIEGVKTLPRE